MVWDNFVISMKLSQQEECFFYYILNDDISLFFIYKITGKKHK